MDLFGPSEEQPRCQLLSSPQPLPSSLPPEVSAINSYLYTVVTYNDNDDPWTRKICRYHHYSEKYICVVPHLI